MSVKNYRFVSPGVFVNEIDNSQLPASPAGIGPVIIGRAEKGPALRPVTVNSFSEFVNVFGAPVPGGTGGDVWREGNQVSPMYGTYAAQAYLRNSSPLTYIRLLGSQSPNASGAGLAGWQLSSRATASAYGLFIFDSGSLPAGSGGGSTGGTPLTGALAAIWYVANGTTVSLSGNIVVQRGTGSVLSTPVAARGTNAVMHAISNANYEFKVCIANVSGTTDLTSSFNFDTNSEKYIRNIFNTNPQLTNGTVTSPSQQVNYFLGETFDQHLKSNIASGVYFGAILPLYNSGSSQAASNFQSQVVGAEGAFVIGQDLSNDFASYVAANQQQLFKVVTLNEAGDWSNRNIKVSIQDIKESTNTSNPYGTFSVVVRRLSDSDNVVEVIEQFNDCDLNPNSLNYVARKIGSQYTSWVPSERRYRTLGDWPNVSEYIRVQMNSDVDAGATDARYLPFGYLGITKWRDEDIEAAATSRGGNWITGSRTDFPTAVTASSALPILSLLSASTALAANLLYPTPAFRVSASEGGLSNQTDAYFGFRTTVSLASTRFAPSVVDIVRPRGGIVGSFTPPNAQTERSVAFSLDDIGPNAGTARWSQTGRSGGTSYTAATGSTVGVLDAGYDRFTLPVYGGFNGLNIVEMDPFRNTFIDDSNDEDLNYARSTIKRAIDATADPEVVEMNLASVPGLTDDGLTTHLIQTCEDRGDALAVVDVAGGFSPRAEGRQITRNNTSAALNTIITNLRNRGLNSSYGCTFYPWLRARDSINGAMLWVPPSVAAIGTFSSSQRKTQVWFAPAGFNRGGLSEGSAGIPIIDVSQQLTRQNRDDLYSANINPIAKFPSEGIVVFGQKTLQVTPSALDRINVRRLMIFVKKRISQIASGLLFDPNVQQTWLRFTSQVNPFLANVQTNFGLTDYKVVLDDTTTTPDLVDRNILYARIFLKPARAIEFIAIDFNITRTGAAFDD
tara:strand:- start:24903 stop:27773 length:2871 start_codon:yes stop_codon:yes gene_type:complete